MTESSYNLVHSEFGKPQSVLQYQQSALQPLNQGEALIEMLYSNINPSDMGMIAGSYGKLKELPATAGREGVGRIVEINGASQLKVGDVVKMPESQGVWRSHVTAPTEELFQIPAELDPKQAATLFINPTTAFMLLESFVDLKPGDWIIQNAANSQVGLWVIQLASQKGIKTINVVRRDGLESELKKLGADYVIVDNKDYPKSLKELTGGAKPKLALNSVGGESVSNMIKTLADGGICVTFGGMVGDPIRFPTRFLIFNDVQLRGFWMDKWMRTHSREDVDALYQKVYNCVTEHKIETPIEAIYPLKDFQSALDAFQQPRMGKVLFKS